MWNCGSWTPNGTWLANSSQVRQLPAAARPEISPISPRTTQTSTLRCGSITVRYASSPCCSADTGRFAGRRR